VFRAETAARRVFLAFPQTSLYSASSFVASAKQPSRHKTSETLSLIEIPVSY
jgi:hypothetical protein